MILLFLLAFSFFIPLWVHFIKSCVLPLLQRILIELQLFLLLPSYQDMHYDQDPLKEKEMMRSDFSRIISRDFFLNTSISGAIPELIFWI